MVEQKQLLMCRKIFANRRGAALVELAIAAPTFFLFAFAVFGAGFDAFYQQALDDAVRDATRQVQLGAQASSSGSNFVSAICAELSVLDSSCASNISYVVQASTASAGFSSLSPQTLSASGTYSNTFFSGTPLAPGVPVLAQVAYPLPFTLPYIGNVLTGTNTSSIVSTAAVRVEPYQ